MLLFESVSGMDVLEASFGGMILVWEWKDRDLISVKYSGRSTLDLSMGHVRWLKKISGWRCVPIRDLGDGSLGHSANGKGEEGELAKHSCG